MVNIQIVSRYVPIEGRAGHFTYLLKMLRYLQAHGCRLELDVLDPWFLPEKIPASLHQIAQVVIMPTTFLQTSEPSQKRYSVTTLLRPLYGTLPPRMLTPLRSLWYRLHKRAIPGQHLPDAVATDPEIAFVKDRFVTYRPAVLITNETFLGNILSACQSDMPLLKVNIAFDVQHQRCQQLEASGMTTGGSVWNRQKEIDLLQAADLIVAIHENDAQTIRNMLPQADVLCAPFPARLQPHHAAEQIPGRCLFVGSSITPNVHGMQWFVTEVWPRILQQQPHATLHVCGAVCEYLPRAAPNVVLRGRVENLAPEYGAAEICVIPLLAGSGLKIKLVEALAHGRACVATSVGVQGVRELAGRAVVIVDTSDMFAVAVVTLLQQPKQRIALEEGARRYVHEYLAPKRVYHPLLHRIMQFEPRRDRQKTLDKSYFLPFHSECD